MSELTLYSVYTKTEVDGKYFGHYKKFFSSLAESKRFVKHLQEQANVGNVFIRHEKIVYPNNILSRANGQVSELKVTTI